MNRTLELFINGHATARGSRLCLHGRADAELKPDLWYLDIYNVPEGWEIAFPVSATVSVKGEGGSLLAEGRILEGSYDFRSGDRVLTLCFSDCMPFWESTVSLSLPPGKTPEETAEALLEACSHPVVLGAFPPSDRVFSRGQSFHGRAADCLKDLARSEKARIFMHRHVLYILRGDGGAPARPAPEDLLDTPVRTSGATLVTTSMKGWPVGFSAVLPTGEKGRIQSQVIHADNREGPWSSTLILVPET